MNYPTDSAFWEVDGFTAGGMGGFSYIKRVLINGDTLLDNKTFGKIYSVMANSDNPHNIVFGDFTYVGGIRVDDNGHPWIIDKHSTAIASKIDLG